MSVRIDIFRARNTTGVAINSHRITSVKPIGLAHTLHTFVVRKEEILSAIEGELGEWKLSESDSIPTNKFVCSLCQGAVFIRQIRSKCLYKYCPHCGSRMKEVTADENA